ncbi:MAG: hypothetical protein P8J87_10785, partial [Verrucomicrobiales bacterium]|nr:hypothetical protein [Verrucomicrobiales bacterium]
MKRRNFLASGAVAALAGAGVGTAGGESAGAKNARRGLRIGCSTYSFWGFRNEDYRSIEKCIELSADMGFDGVEVLQVQMTGDSNEYFQKIKRRAFTLGLDLMGFSTHQGFVTPDKEKWQKDVDHTILCI